MVLSVGWILFLAIVPSRGGGLNLGVAAGGNNLHFFQGGVIVISLVVVVALARVDCPRSAPWIGR
jgi:hypothetical protein